MPYSLMWTDSPCIEINFNMCLMHSSCAPDLNYQGICIQIGQVLLPCLKGTLIKFCSENLIKVGGRTRPVCSVCLKTKSVYVISIRVSSLSNYLFRVITKIYPLRKPTNFYN